MKAVLFDLDNTLVDFVRFKREATKAALKAMKKAGLKTDKDWEHLLRIYWKAGIDGNTAFSTFLRQEIGKVDPELLKAAIRAYLKKKEEVVKPYPNVIPTLKALKDKGLKLGIVTDAPRAKARRRLEMMGIKKYFDVIVTVDDTGMEKPNPKPFRKALDKLRVPASEVLFVGDIPLRDVKGASEVGMNTALAKYGLVEGFLEDAKKVKPDFVLEDVKDVLKHV